MGWCGGHTLRAPLPGRALVERFKCAVGGDRRRSSHPAPWRHPRSIHVSISRQLKLDLCSRMLKRYIYDSPHAKLERQRLYRWQARAPQV